VLLHAASRSLWGGRDYRSPSRFLEELPVEEIERERLRPTSWSGYGAPGASLAPSGPAPSLSTGDSVRHSTLGEGVVVGMSGDGTVTVRFAQDGAERRLMLEYAPLEKV
jgi:DNA helicase-2/ATP-dependent DNA helicase PcrA